MNERNKNSENLFCFSKQKWVLVRMVCDDLCDFTNPQWMRVFESLAALWISEVSSLLLCILNCLHCVCMELQKNFWIYSYSSVTIFLEFLLVCINPSGSIPTASWWLILLENWFSGLEWLISFLSWFNLWLCWIRFYNLGNLHSQTEKCLLWKISQYLKI